MTRTRARARAILHLSLCLLLLSISGCAALGLVAQAIPITVHARYPGLQGQTVGVLVWADRGILIDWDPIRLDLANAVQARLEERYKAEEMKGTTFPWKPASLVRYVRDHPGTDSAPITQVAPSFHVTRLIYIEVLQFHTRAERSLELYRGQATVSLKIIEIGADGSSKVAYNEDNLKATFPKTAPQDGEPGLGDYKTYYGTLNMLADTIADRLTTHEEEREH